MSEDRSIVARLKFLIDRAGLKGVTDGTKQVKGQLDQTAKSAQDLEAIAKKLGGSMGGELAKVARSKALDDLTRKFVQVAAETGDAETALKEFSAELSKVGATEAEIAKVTKQFDRLAGSMKQPLDRAKQLGDAYDDVSARVGLFGDAGSNVRTIGGAAEAAGLGAAGRGISQIAELPDTIEAVTRLKSSFVGLPAQLGAAASSLGPFGLAAIAVGGSIAIAGKQIADSLKEVDQAIVAGVQANRTVEELIASGATTAEVEAFLKERQQIIETETAILNRNNQKYAAAEDAALDQFGDLGGKLAFGIVQMISSGEQATADAIKQSETTIATAQAEINQVLQAQAEGRFTTNDTTAAEERLATVRRGQVIQAAEDAAMGELRRVELMNQSSDALRDRLQAIEAEKRGIEAAIAILRESGDTSEETAAAMAAYERRLANLSDETKLITGEALKLSEARERELEAIEAQRAAQEKLTAAQKSLKANTDATADAIEKAQADSALKVEKIEADASKRREKLLTDTIDASIKAETSAGEKRLKAETDRADKQAQLEVDLAQRRIDIQRKFNTSLANAIGERDALAALMAQRQRDEELQKVDETASEQASAIETNYQRQLETISSELSKQQDELRARYAQQLSELQAATADQIQAERDRLTQLATERKNALDLEKQALDELRASAAGAAQGIAQVNAGLQKTAFGSGFGAGSGALQKAANGSFGAGSSSGAALQKEANKKGGNGFSPVILVDNHMTKSAVRKQAMKVMDEAIDIAFSPM